MLVLSRQVGEGITISTPSGTLHVTVEWLGAKYVKLGFAGPPCFRVLRDEIMPEEGDHKCTVPKT